MGQLDIFESEIPKSFKHEIRNGEFIFIENFFNKLECEDYFNALLKKISWKQESMNIYGKEVLFPRLTAWYGDCDKSYSFSGIKLNPEQWTYDLLVIKHKIEAVAGISFNSVLLNLYRSGEDSISWHTDAERELGINPVIASVSFGSERIFQLKHNASKDIIEMNLTNGSLLIMQGELQHFWKHRVPKVKNENKPRINLTFRVIL